MSKHTFEETLSVVGQFNTLEELVLTWLEAKTGHEGGSYIDNIDMNFQDALLSLDSFWIEHLKEIKENETEN